MNTPSFLFQSRHGVWYFRYIFPRTWQKRLGRSEIRRSLYTYNRAQAIRYARRLATLLESRLLSPYDSPMEYREIRAILDPYLDALKTAVDERIHIEGPLSYDATQGKKAGLEADRNILKLGICPAEMEPKTLKLIEAHDLAIKPGTEEFEQLCMEVTKLYIAAHEYRLEKDKEIGAYTIGRSAKQSIPAHSPTGPNLKEVISSYLAEQRLKPKTLDEYKAALDLFTEIVGNQPVSGITHEDLRHYKDILQKLPPNMKKMPRLKGKTVEQIAAIKDLKHISVTTFNKNLGRVSTFFDWALRNGYVTFNYAKGKGLKKTTRPHEERDPFSDEDLKKLFIDNPLYKENDRKRPDRYWIPLIAAHTGMRLEEICQLHKSDIREVDGIWVIDINDDGEKGLKTASSKRLIPIHQSLIDLGLVEYAKSRTEGHLWVHLKKSRDGYGRNLGSWFNREIRKLGISNKKVTFHSLRHTVANQLKQQDIPAERIAELLGHANDSITTGRYGKTYDVKKQLSIVERITIPVIEHNNEHNGAQNDD